MNIIKDGSKGGTQRNVISYTMFIPYCVPSKEHEERPGVNADSPHEEKRSSGPYKIVQLSQVDVKYLGLHLATCGVRLPLPT
jgi:hypothetical protein